jgi:hypothetical protein
MKDAAALRVAVFVLYLPVAGAVAVALWQALYLLLRLQPAAAFGLLYAAVLWLVLRRAVRVLRGGVPRPWADLALLLVADALIGFLLVSSL